MIETLNRWIHSSWISESLKPWAGEYKGSETMNESMNSQLRPEQVNAWNPNTLNGWKSKTLSRWIKHSLTRIYTIVIHEITNWMDEFKHRNRRKMETNEQVKTKTLSRWMFETLSGWKQTPWADECLKPWAGWLNETLSGLTEWNPERVDWMKPWAGWQNETLSGLIEMKSWGGWLNETLNGWIKTLWAGECLKPWTGEY